MEQKPNKSLLQILNKPSEQLPTAGYIALITSPLGIRWQSSADDDIHNFIEEGDSKQQLGSTSICIYRSITTWDYNTIFGKFHIIVHMF